MTISQQYIYPCRDYKLFSWLERIRNKVRDLFSSILSSESELRPIRKEFEGMIKEYMPIVSRICFSFANGTDDYKDLQQDTLLNLWQGFPKFRGEAAIATWIYRVTFNTCVATTRRSGRMRSVPLSQQLASSLGDIDQTLIREQQERLDHLHWLMQRLAPIDRAILVMWLDECSYDEIASVMGLNRNNVATRLRRSRLKLIEINKQNSDNSKTSYDD